MAQYRITSADIIGGPEPDDCLLPDNDPAWDLIELSSTSKIGFDPANPRKAQSTTDAEGTV